MKKINFTLDDKVHISPEDFRKMAWICDQVIDTTLAMKGNDRRATASIFCEALADFMIDVKITLAEAAKEDAQDS